MAVTTEGACSPRRDKVAALIHRIHAQNMQHFGRPLANHLLGCHDLLEKWGASRPLCLAGAFHSIYGTATFTNALIASTGRRRIRAMIGERAEYIVFLFCFGDRRRLMLDNGDRPYHWFNRDTGEPHPLEDASFHDLVVLEAANFIEQLPYIGKVEDDVIDDMCMRLANQAHHLTISMRADLDTALATCRHRRVGWRVPG